MESSEDEYAEFIKKVRRTIYADNISPKVTETVIEAAFDQFGKVVKVEFIPTYIQPEGTPRAALVEMENRKQAEQIILGMENFPLMIAGMPRPVRAKPARMEMFDDRPSKLGQLISCRWLHPKDPSFQTANRIKQLVKKHAAESSFLLKQQLAAEEDLAKNQEEMLKSQHKKLELIHGVFADGNVQRLAQHYGIDMKKN